ncbi:hypothetical protein SNE40_011081 [Patella caerulea]|uniref:Uncharacterized protein n=1 Tax=Patella caerulea TaxID=87958 RepID=A0AAN8Q5X6_PATCE
MGKNIKTTKLISSSFFQTRLLLLTTILAVLVIVENEARSHYQLACDPRSAHMSCLMGCLTCFDSYGGELYDTAACCRDCQDYNANLIDYGPADCSHKYIRSSWLKRFG